MSRVYIYIPRSCTSNWYYGIWYRPVDSSQGRDSWFLIPDITHDIHLIQATEVGIV